MRTRPRLMGALVGSLAAFALAGGGLALAQESPGTTEPPAAEAPATTAPDAAPPDAGAEGRSPEDCPDKDGAAQDAPSAGSSTSL